MDARTRALVEGPVVRTLLRLAAPNVVMMVVQSAVGLMEAYFVGRLGTDALAGVALVVPLLMLMQMMSAGAVGGGMSSAVARALGSGRREDANALVWHALAIGVGFAAIATVLMLAFGRPLYRLMGGTGAALDAAVVYSDWLFAGIVLLWVFNALASVLRGSGNFLLPATVVVAGAAIAIPLSPALIFGWGPLPPLGIAGAAIAVNAYYALGIAVLAFSLWTGRTVLHPPRTPPAWQRRHFGAILKVGAVAALVSATTNLTVAIATGLVGNFGTAAIAGYGIGSRLEYLLIPLVFGLGAPLVAMVGTAIGAGRRERALHVTWIGAAIAGCVTETIGVAAALFPAAWLGIFGDDPSMIATGTTYLRIVGPFFGFFGFGMALYFASQGAGRVQWALAAGLVRLGVAAGLGSLAFATTGALWSVFAALAAALVAFGAINAFAVASGKWFAGDAGRRST